MKMDSWHSYPSIYALGHNAVLNLLTVAVNVEEKVDGSQFSFGVTEAGEIKVRSKGAELYPDAPEKMFAAAVASVKELAPVLHPGWTYRGEYLQKSKHNALAYNRVPRHHVILFDINPGHEAYLPYEEKAAEAERIGMEVVPLLFSGNLSSPDFLRGLLERESVLGGQKIEGVVVKPRHYDLFGPDKKVRMGKFVSEAFKEVHAKEWKKQNPSGGDILDVLALRYRSEARWSKAVMHLAEAGALEGSPRDIGALLKEIPADIEKECADEIRDALYKWAWPHIRRRVAAGLPEWYKERLLQAQFAEVPPCAYEVER